MDRPVKTFCIGFEEKEYDESQKAREVADLFKTDHSSLVVKPDAVAVLPKLVWHYNEPFADSSGIPSFYLAELAAREVKVALNGDGGDETFAGYLRYRAHALADRFSFLPGPLRKVFFQGALALLPGKSGSGVGTLWRLKRFLRQAAASPERRNFNWFCYLDEALKARLYTPEFREASASIPAWILMEEAYRTSDGPDFLSRTLDVDFRTYLPGDLLVKMDIATMAHSLEGRSPFLDHELLEFAARIPATLKLKGRRSKHILKVAVRDLLPEQVLNQPKAGFGVPIDAWLRGPLKEMAFDVLTGPKADRGLFKLSEVRRLLDEHVQGRAMGHLPLWALLMLELWYRRFIDGKEGARTS
jgi:asparagine synthase (glutamine-hydrolysing)